METGIGEEVIVQFSGNQICVTNPTPSAGENPDHIYAYDHLYDLDSNTEQLFLDMGQPLVEGLFEGYNGTIFAYGQTGSGKTHSMMGNSDDPGVIPRVAADVFERIAALPEGASGVVYASYIQIYREVLQDLIGSDPTGGDLKIRRDPKQGTYVQGLSERPLKDAAGLTALIEQGNKKRAVASTLMNAESSRSHAVVIFRLEQEHPAQVVSGRGKRRINSKINLVDLAGSERSSKTGATGETLKEAIAINQSLSALGNVINALTDSKSKGHIPYRSSKLTHLLEESLGGNSNTVMIAAIGPAGRNYAETSQTLQYASRAKLIVTHATANTFEEKTKGSPFAGAAEMQAAMQAEMAASLAAQQQALEQQMAGMRGVSPEELTAAKEEIVALKTALAKAEALSEMCQKQVEVERQRAEEADRQRQGVAEGAEGTVAAMRKEAEAAQRRAEQAHAAAEATRERERELAAAELAAAKKAAEDALAAKELVAVESLDLQVARASLSEELREGKDELNALKVKLAAAAERAEQLGAASDQLRSQLRSAEAQRDQAWAREKLLDEQRAAAEAHARASAEAAEDARKQLQATLSSQLEAQRGLAMQRSEAEGDAMRAAAETISEVQRSIARLEAKHEEAASKVAGEAESRAKAHEGELARLDSLLQAQAAAHSASVEKLEARAAAEAQRLLETARQAADAAEKQLADVQARLREAQEGRVRLQAENSTRKAAADALGERVALLQDSLNTAQLDATQQRHAAIAERAELEDGLRSKTQEVEATRMQMLEHQHEAERMRQQLRERDESLARRAERLRQLQALYERVLHEKQRVEEAAWAERQELHEERRALELRVREEAGRARQAMEASSRSGDGGLLSRLFGNEPMSRSGPIDRNTLVVRDTSPAARSPPKPQPGGRPKEAWVEQTPPNGSGGANGNGHY